MNNILLPLLPLLQEDRAEGPPIPPPLPPMPLDTLIKCFICKQYYNHARRPKVLNCGHTFCSTCMKGVVNCKWWEISRPECVICHASIFQSKAAYLPYNYSLDSIVPPLKKHLGLTCKSQQVQNKEGKVDALRKSMNKENEVEIRNNLERGIKGRINKEVRKKLEIEKANLRRLKDKLETEYKKEKKTKRLEKTQALMIKEIKNLKALRNQERSKVRHLMNENKKLLAEKDAIIKRNERECRYKNRASHSP